MIDTLETGAEEITGLNYTTLYYVYFDQEPEIGALIPSGGTVTYQVTDTKENAMAGTFRFYVGSIITPGATSGITTVGNNDGGGGAQTGFTSSLGFTLAYSGSSTAGNGTLAAEINAIDGDLDTYATMTATGNGSTNISELAIAASPPINSSQGMGLTLNLLRAVTVNSSVAHVGFCYTVFLNIGSTQYVVEELNYGAGTLAKSLVTYAIPPLTPLSQVSVTIQVVMGTVQGSGELVANIYECWVSAVS
jgi:hypothetical protein